MIDEKDYYIYLKKKKPKINVKLLYMSKAGAPFVFSQNSLILNSIHVYQILSHQFSETLRLLEEVHLD